MPEKLLSTAFKTAVTFVVIAILMTPASFAFAQASVQTCPEPRKLAEEILRLEANGARLSSKLPCVKTEGTANVRLRPYLNEGVEGTPKIVAVDDTKPFDIISVEKTGSEQYEVKYRLRFAEGTKSPKPDTTDSLVFLRHSPKQATVFKSCAGILSHPTHFAIKKSCLSESDANGPRSK